MASVFCGYRSRLGGSTTHTEDSAMRQKTIKTRPPENAIRETCAATRAISTRNSRMSDLPPELRHVHNESFGDDPGKEMVEQESVTRILSAAPGHSTAFRGTLGSLSTTPLLSADEEKRLFRRMNFVKYRAAQLWAVHAPGWRDEAVLLQFRCLMDEADVIRNYIVNANTRLVVSIARKFQGGAFELDELISTGNLVLIKAVERFNYSLGFRFSTYATHSIRRELYRQTRKASLLRKAETATENDILLESVAAAPDSDRYAEQQHQLRDLSRLMQKILSDRELQILASRYGLNDEGQGRTLREVGQLLGISKERVRQLQMRAIQRLQQFVTAEPLRKADLPMST